MAPTKERPATKTIATNREARHEYFVLEALETGVELKGTEVKSLRAGGVNLKDSWVDIEDGELLVKGGELPVTSVRLTKAVPKDMIFPVMDEIRKVVLTAPVKAGTIVLHNVCGLDSDVMVTKNVDAC